MKLKHVAVVALMAVLVGQCGNDSDGEPGAGDAPRPSAVDPRASPEGPRAERRRTRQAPRRSSQPPAPAPTSVEAPAPGTALAALGLLAVKGRAPMTGYDRDRFGPAWLDADRNGCDTRNDVLGQHLRAVTREDNGCVVAAGAYDDPYTGVRIDYWQGHGALIDIDHVVSLGNAWAMGAHGWEIRRRAAFANDPLNLLPADAGANRAKGDGDAATWLPPHKPFRCAYVSRQVAVKSKYDLAVTAAERAAVQRVLAGCHDQALPPDTWGAATTVDHRITDPVGSGQDATVPPCGAGQVYFSNCDAARAAGAAPVRRGDPGYGDHLDGDGDGAACE